MSILMGGGFAPYTPRVCLGDLDSRNLKCARGGTAIMCDCIKKVADKGYVHRDILHADTYFLYPVTWDNGRGKVRKTGMLVNFCPVCGEKQPMNVR